MLKLTSNSLSRAAGLVAAALVVFGCGSQSVQSGSESQPKGRLTLVTGITGNQGSGVANTLLEEGHRVRGMTRNTSSDKAEYWSDRGAEMVYADFTNRDSIDAALEGVDFVFINLQEQVPDYINATKYFLDTANAAGVKHMLYSSSRPSDPDLDVASPGKKRDIEIYLRESSYSYSILRIPMQMSSVIRDMAELLTVGWRGRGSESKTFAWFSPDDLGPIALAAIENHEAWSRREVNLSGDRLSDPELVSMFRELSGLEIEYTRSPEGEMRWRPLQDMSYDTEELRAEFPMTTFREYLIEKNFGENLRAMAAEQ